MKSAHSYSLLTIFQLSRFGSLREFAYHVLRSSIHIKQSLFTHLEVEKRVKTKINICLIDTLPEISEALSNWNWILGESINWCFVPQPFRAHTHINPIVCSSGRKCGWADVKQHYLNLLPFQHSTESHRVEFILGWNSVDSYAQWKCLFAFLITQIPP